MNDVEKIEATARAIAEHAGAALPPETPYGGATINEETGKITIILGGRGWCLVDDGAITWEPHERGLRVSGYSHGEPLGARVVESLPRSGLCSRVHVARSPGASPAL